MYKEPDENNVRTLDFLRTQMKNDGMKEFDARHVGYYLWEFDQIWESKRQNHRWWNLFDRVVKVADKFIMFGWAETTGDNSIFDVGWEFNEDDVFEVEPFEKVVVDYRKKE